MKTTLLLAALSLSLAPFSFGCSAADGSNATTSSADTAATAATAATDDSASGDITTDASHRLSGTYESVGNNTLDLLYTTYTFSSNGTFRAVGGCDAKSNCHAITEANGTYTTKSEKSGTRLELVDSLGNHDTYIYSASGNTLTFNETVSGPTHWFFKTSWTKNIPIGDVCQDNDGTSLGECSDSGNFGCGVSDLTANVSTCTPLD